jgi:ubiquinone/menaquinone biosynthesis C-methylase UbiE
VKSQAAHFDDVAAGYDGSVPAHIAQHLNARRVALAESLAPRGNVLDVGCGTGRFLATLPNRYERVGLDLSPGMLARARAKGLEVVQASSERIPFPDDSFDLVTTFAVIHHLIDRKLVQATLREMARVARPGGAVIVWDHNPRNLYWPILMSKLPQDQGNEMLVPARQIVDTLHSAGTREVSLRRMTFVPDFIPPRALPVMSHVERLLERLPLVNLVAAHNVVIARL